MVGLQCDQGPGARMTIPNTYENYSHHWWTPENWMNWVHRSYGTSIDWKPLYDVCPRIWDGQDMTVDRWGRYNYVNHPGARGSVKLWWGRAIEALAQGKEVIWCSFNDEQHRHMYPSLYEVPGWLILPRTRIKFVWGGPDVLLKNGKWRYHGDIGKSPGNYTTFWSSVKPATPPVDCVIVRTGQNG